MQLTIIPARHYLPCASISKSPAHRKSRVRPSAKQANVQQLQIAYYTSASSQQTLHTLMHLLPFLDGVCRLFTTYVIAGRADLQAGSGSSMAMSVVTQYMLWTALPCPRALVTGRQVLQAADHSHRRTSYPSPQLVSLQHPLLQQKAHATCECNSMDNTCTPRTNQP